MALSTLRCAIEDIAGAHPELFLETHAVACVAVLGKYSESPGRLEVECADLDSPVLRGATEFRLELTWSPVTAEKARRLRATIQTNPLVEAAAVAVALVLTHKIVPLAPLDVTEYGDRADFRSLSARRVLEISGTLRLSELARLHRQKVKQARANPFGWDAYVIVCAFSSKGHRVRFTGHRRHKVEHEVENGESEN